MAVSRFFYKSIPFLPVKNLDDTIDYYTRQLGFGNAWFWGDPPTDAGCSRDQLSLLFHRDPAFAIKIAGLELVMFVDDVDGIYEEFRCNPVIDITSDICDEPWGIREFTIRDPNGYGLRLSCSIARIQKMNELKNGHPDINDIGGCSDQP